MISHKHKCIFIHIPKCAGSSIRDHFFQRMSFDWRAPNYDVLYGWCPNRKIHLQHATAKQLLETELIKEDIWNEYFKFTIVRNPWDRAYSDYLWIMADRKLKGSFKDYINKIGPFRECLRNENIKTYRGDHLIPQTEFYSEKGKLQLDFIGRFEQLLEDIALINKKLNITNMFNSHEKKNESRLSHYSLFYTASRKKLIDDYYARDIEQLNYSFEDKRKGLRKLKKLI